MRSLKVSKIIPLAFVAIIICLTLTMFQGYNPLFRRQWIFLAAISVLGVITSFNYCTTRQFIALVIYITIIYLNVLTGDKFWSASGQWLYEFFLLLAPSIMAWYAFKTGDEKFMKVVIITFFVIVAFETIASFIANMQFPEIVRNLNKMRDDDLSTESAWIYYRFGVANYDIGHALPATVPLLVMGIKESANNKKKRWLLAGILAITLLMVYISYSTTALILAVFGLFLAIFSHKGSLKSNQGLIFLVLIFAPFLLSETIMAGALDFVDGFVDQESSLHDKLSAMSETLRYGDTSGDVSAREERYTQTWDLFTTNILTGTNASVGGHSSLLDRLGTLGIIGFIPYVLFLYYQISFSKFRIKKEYRIFYLEGAMLCIFMLIIKDADSWELFFTLFTLIPFMAYLFSKKPDYTYEKTGNFVRS